jgi:hypothetical protein
LHLHCSFFFVFTSPACLLLHCRFDARPRIPICMQYPFLFCLVRGCGLLSDCTSGLRTMRHGASVR